METCRYYIFAVYIYYFFRLGEMKWLFLLLLTYVNAETFIDETTTHTFDVLPGEIYHWSNNGDDLANFFVTHDGYADGCSQVEMWTTNIYGTSYNVSVVGIDEDAAKVYYTCKFILDYVYSTDDQVTDGTELYLHFKPASASTNIIYYTRESQGAIVRTGPSEEQYLMRNVSMTFDNSINEFIVDTTVSRSALTNISCATPTVVDLTIGSTCNLQGNLYLVDTNTDSYIFRSTIDRNTIFGCSDGPPVDDGNGKIKYTFTTTVNDVLSYTTTGTQWAANDPICDSTRSFVASDRDSHQSTVSMDTSVNSASSSNVTVATFDYQANSIVMDYTICSGRYSSLMASMLFTMVVEYPSTTTTPSFHGTNDLSNLSPYIGSVYGIQIETGPTCTGTTCTTTFRTSDCLPVASISATQCKFELPDLTFNIWAYMDGDFSQPITQQLPVSTFVSASCPQLGSINDVTDVFPVSLVAGVDGKDYTLVMTLDDVEDNSNIALEILDVRVSLYYSDDTLFATQVFSKNNKLDAMQLVDTPYYEDAHYCRYFCTAFYKYGTSRAHAALLDAAGLYPTCHDEVTSRAGTNSRNYDLFTFNPSNWLFKDFNDDTGYFNFTVISAIRECATVEDAFATDGRHAVSVAPTTQPTLQPTTMTTSGRGSAAPSGSPTTSPIVTGSPTASPTTGTPTTSPTANPTANPTASPTYAAPKQLNVDDPTNTRFQKIDPGNKGDKTFGASIAVQGDTMIVGAPSDDNGIGAWIQPGAVLIYKFDSVNAEWVYSQKLRSDLDGSKSYSYNYNKFGQTVSIDGDYIAVGEPWGLSYDRGSVWVFEYDSTTQLYGNAVEIKLDSAVRVNGDHFGYSVKLYGNYLLVGAIDRDDLGTSSGAAYLFQRQVGNSWSQLQMLPGSSGSANDQFGVSVDINQYGAVVGTAAFDNNTGTATGAVYAYSWNSSNLLNEEQILLDEQLQADSQYGISVSLSATRLAVGSSLYDTINGVDSGKVFVYELNVTDSLWYKTTEMIGTGVTAGDSFGNSVHLNGDWLAVGGETSDISGTASGGVWTFRNVAGTWVERDFYFTNTTNNTDYDLFGASVFLTDTDLYVGAPQTSSQLNTNYVYYIKDYLGTTFRRLLSSPMTISVVHGFGGVQYINTGNMEVSTDEPVAAWQPLFVVVVALSYIVHLYIL